MTETFLNFPEDYEEYAWEVEAKGWFSAATLTFAGKRFRLNFYDSRRLAQEIEGKFERGRVFFEPNLVVVQSLTRSNMENAVAQLIERGDVSDLIVSEA